ncbi:MAG: DNA polymerase Y family protein [Burkholderiaceae bacterium]
MLWIAVCLPELPLEVTACDAPLAVCDASHVLLANRSACRAGIQAGMKRATALAIYPYLLIRLRAAAQENHALQAIAAWAQRFTPNVALVAPRDEPDADLACGLLLEISGSLKLFDGPMRIVKKLRAGLAQQGHAAQFALAPVPQAAWMLARSQQNQARDDQVPHVGEASELSATLANLPVWLLGPSQPHWDALRGIGVTRVADLRQLPRSGIARRFSARLLDELDRALGRKSDPREWFVAPPVFEAKLELLARVDHAEALLFAARRMIVQMTGWLAARHAATRTIEFTLVHEDREPSLLTLRLADASHDEERMTALLRELLGRTQLVAPVYELHLRCAQIVPLQPSHGELFATARGEQEGLLRLIERLQARLGPAAVTQIELQDDHRPEHAFREVPIDAAGAPASTDASCSAPRPLWMLSEPIPLADHQHRPFYGTPLTLLSGPERIESGWWDGNWAERDYFIARDEQHALLWIFRPRAPDPAARHQWYLHGRFG